MGMLIYSLSPWYASFHRGKGSKVIKKKGKSGLVLNHIILAVAFLTLLPIVVTSGQSVEALCLDFSQPYDMNFKWYNTNGSLPEYRGDHYLFFGGSTTNAYQDAVSKKSLRVGSTFNLSVKLEVYFNTQAFTDRDEFAVFVAEDTEFYKGDEFGFVIRQRSMVLNGYIQSPRTREYFKEFRLDSLELGLSKSYVLKAVYSEVEGKGLVRFFVNDILVASQEYPIVSGKDFYLVLSMKKLSPPQYDTSANQVRVYGACLANLPQPPNSWMVILLLAILMVIVIYVIILYKNKKDGKRGEMSFYFSILIFLPSGCISQVIQQSSIGLQPHDIANCSAFLMNSMSSSTGSKPAFIKISLTTLLTILSGITVSTPLIILRY
jgi:hypothetical protein